MLMKILKGEWNFDGVVVSDWGGCHDTDEAVKKRSRHGVRVVDQRSVDGQIKCLRQLLYGSAVSESYPERQIHHQGTDDKVRRVCLFFRTTMNHHRPTGFLCSESHYDAARKIAQQGIVLLQNRDNVLPLNLNRTKRILVVGENAIKMMTVGGSALLRSKCSVRFLRSAV